MNLIKIIREISAILIWLYAVIKLFIFDIDEYLINATFPKYSYILDYKFFIISGVVALILILNKRKNIFLFFIYILFYPIIIFFWKIPKFIFKQKSWVIAFSVINSLISFLVSFKYTFIVIMIYLFSTLAILKSSSEVVLYLALTLIGGILLVIYVNRIIVIFRRSNVHRFYMSVIHTLAEKRPSNLEVEESIKHLPLSELSEKQLTHRTNNLQTVVLINRLLLFTAVKLKIYNNSKLNFVTYIFTILILILFTVISLTLINYGIFKIDSQLFSYEHTPTIFTFFYYSFNSMLSTPISELIPISPFTQVISMFGVLFAFFIAAIFVTLLFSVRSKKHSEEINEIINGLQEQSSTLEVFIKDEYKLNTIDEALIELERMKALFVKFLYKLTDDIK